MPVTPSAPGGPLLRGAAVLLALLAFWPGVAAAQPLNVVPLTAETPIRGFNRLTVSVTVCAPDHPGRCATIDHIMVDTGSVGLRLQAHAVPRTLDLPPLRDGAGHQVAQCLHFVHDAAWGGLHRADVHLGGLVAADIPVQIIGSGLPLPASCPDSGGYTSNGTLGLGLRATDCEGDCVQSATHPTYLTCDAAGCTGMDGSVPAALRVVNPAQHLVGHDNGIVLDLPMPARRGVARVRGTLTFGVNTAADNGLRGARILHLDPAGHFTTGFDGIDHPGSYIDSGTPYTIVPGSTLPRCRPGGSALCLDPARSFAAVMRGADGAALPMTFLVGRFPADETGVFAAAAMAGAADEPGFVWGAPFFMGRRVALVFRDKAVPGQPGLTGPFYATPR